jgi:uncharacterized protein
MSAEAVATVRRMEDLSQAGDLEGAIALMHPDVVIHEPESMPYGGTHHGRQGAVAMGGMLAEMFEPTGDMQAEYYDAGDDLVIVHLRQPGRSVKTGQQCNTDMIELHTVLSGMIVEIRIFNWDTAAMLRACGVEARADA